MPGTTRGLSDARREGFLEALLLEHLQPGLQGLLSNLLLPLESTLHPAASSDRRELDERRVQGDREPERGQHLQRDATILNSQSREYSP